MAVFLCLGFTLISFTFVAYSRSFYENQAEKAEALYELNTTSEELNKITDAFINYFSFKTNNLQLTFKSGGKDALFFTENELSHMSDVKELFKNVIAGALSLIITGLIILALLIIVKRKESAKFISFGLITGCIIAVAVIAVTALTVMTDFDFFFNLFHKIFFPQGNYEVSAGSNIFCFLSVGTFFDATLLIAVYSVLFIASMLLTGILMRRINNR